VEQFLQVHGSHYALYTKGMDMGAMKKLKIGGMVFNGVQALRSYIRGAMKLSGGPQSTADQEFLRDVIDRYTDLHITPANEIQIDQERSEAIVLPGGLRVNLYEAIGRCNILSKVP
jgi:hypothetical protein